MIRSEHKIRGGTRRTALLIAVLGLSALFSGAALGGVCEESVQGQIAWNYSGDKTWAVRNVQDLCEDMENHAGPARCFEQVMFSGVDWGRGTRWGWRNASKLCRRARSPRQRITCFRRDLAAGASWEEAIDSCVRGVGLSNEVAFEIVDGRGRCIGGVGNAYNPGAPINIAACSVKNLKQRWVFDGRQIINTSGLCLTKAGTLDGTRAGLRPCRNEEQLQHWTIAGGRIRTSRDRAGCLGATSGQDVRIRACEDESTQGWFLRKHPIRALRASATDTLVSQCATDVRSQMQTLTLGKSVGTNFYVENVRSTGHIQGVARLFGEAIAYTDTKGVHLVEFPGKSATGLAAWVRREGNGTVRQTIGVQAPFDHFGGLQAVNGILLVAPMMGNGKASLALYQYSRMVGLEQIASWETSSLSGNAHYAGIVDGAGGRFFLAVGNDDRAEHAPHIVYLYAAEKLDGASPLEHIATWDRGIVNDDYQGISLIKECDSGELYLLGMGARGPGGRVMRRNYIELQHFRGYDPRNRVVDRLKINERNFQAEANDCDPDGGSSFHVTAEGQLVFYCAEKKVKGSEFTVREYR